MESPSITQLETELSNLRARLAAVPNVAEAAQRALADPEMVKAYVLALAERDAAVPLPAQVADIESRLAAARLAEADRELQTEYLSRMATLHELAARYAQLERHMAHLQAQYNQARGGANTTQLRDRIRDASPELFTARNELAEAKRLVTACLAKVNNMIGNPWKNKTWAELLLQGQPIDQPKATQAAKPSSGGAAPNLSELPLAEQIARLQPTWENEP
jgi:predicted  nucleic acid-binding Zn-ribbon protein